MSDLRDAQEHPAGAAADGRPGPAAPPDDLSDRYFDAAAALLRRVRDEERGTLRQAGAAVADALSAGGRVFAFGAGHSSLPAQDVVYRAGGLAVVNLLAVPGAVGVDVVPATLGSALERVGGLAAAVLETSPARAGDVLFVISLSGRNVLPVEMARGARERGLTVIGVTSLAYAGQTASRHPDGTFLKDHCDLVVDSKIPVGDAELTDPCIPAPFGPASTVVVSALMQAVMALAASGLAARGETPPMIRSGNVDGGLDWNARVFEEHRDRIFFRN
ncbi:SIS domain-containing protein [Actinacidiphila yeochonensis]|uniref:SIS domain-containing protein n=1 Tax=Actinacidiphila yeochonensis TaxID=89050 RepID=UPI00056C129C|nr:SIS domain-containing protein [Actinacidiphila yeochonensis]